MRPAIDPALARSIDRLARRAHAFHRFAHHPLCDRYAGEVVRVGRRARVCRGCTFAAAGALAGALLGLGLAKPPTLLASAAATLVLLAAAILGARARGRRPSKLVTRALPAGLVAASLGLAVRSPDPRSLGIAALASSFALAGWAAYRRRGPDRSACAGCPEGPPGPRCSGFRPVARRERAFARVADRMLRAAGRPRPLSTR